MDVNGLQHEVAEIRLLMEERLHIRGRDLEAQFRKAGRLLPRAIRREAEFLTQANLLIQNPKLARMIDAARARRAHQAIVRHLKSIDPKAERRGRILNFAAFVAFILLIVGIATVSVLYWRGLV